MTQLAEYLTLAVTSSVVTWATASALDLRHSRKVSDTWGWFNRHMRDYWNDRGPDATDQVVNNDSPWPEGIDQ